MSGYDGQKEAPLASTKDKKRESFRSYRFRWVKKLVDVVVPPDQQIPTDSKK